MPESNRLLRAARERTPSRRVRGAYMSREELAEAVVLWAADHDDKHRSVAFDANHLGKLERGTVGCPRQPYLDALCAVLGATPAELGFYARAAATRPLRAGLGSGGQGAGEAPADPDDQERMVSTMSPWGVVADPSPASVEPIDEEFIANLRTRMQELLTLDAQVGGNETSTQALRLFRSVHRRVGVSSCPRYLRRDLYATVGELAEIAGWLFYDADRQDAMRRMNHEALYYLRWTGHRSLELLTLQNISMQAEYLNRPSEALHIVQSVLETGRLSPRIESLLLARGAHALAQQQQRAEALRSFRKARALYLDGPRDDDPAWAYWVDERQFAWFEAVLYAELGERDKPAAIFAEALATSPKHRVRGLYSRSVYLFENLINAGDWQEAELLVPKLAPYISEVGSGRTASILRKTLRAAQRADIASTLDDGVMWLRELMNEAQTERDIASINLA